MEKLKVQELNSIELMHINGGRRVSTESSIAYDVGWWLGHTYRSIEDTVKGWFD